MVRPTNVQRYNKKKTNNIDFEEDEDCLVNIIEEEDNAIEI